MSDGKELPVKYYQTPFAKETIAIILDPENDTISIGIVRAGKEDSKNGLITSERGMEIARGRAMKAMELKGALTEKNYLRGLHAARVSMVYL